MLRKLSEKWVDEFTGMKAEITPSQITVTPEYAPRGRKQENAFYFIKSSRKTFAQVADSLQRFAALQDITAEEGGEFLSWAEEEKIVTRLVEVRKHEHTAPTSERHTLGSILQGLRETQGTNVPGPSDL